MPVELKFLNRKVQNCHRSPFLSCIFSAFRPLPRAQVRHSCFAIALVSRVIRDGVFLGLTAFSVSVLIRRCVVDRLG